MAEISVHKVYLYDHVRHLLAVDNFFCPLRDNAPMTKNPILLHKGLDNKVIFRALGPDRIPVNIACNQQVYARIIDPSNKMVVLEKLCRLGPAKGVITVEIDGGDLAIIAAGRYTMVMIRTEEFVVGAPDYYVELPLYSDMNDNVAMEVEITEQAFKTPPKEFVIEEKDWTPDMNIMNSGPVVRSFYSGRIPGGRVLNHVTPVHSFSTYSENFTGVLELWGSLEDTPDPYTTNRWFKIFPTTMSVDIEYTGYTGTQAWTHEANIMWLKFRLIPSSAVVDPGVMKKIIVRP